MAYNTNYISGCTCPYCTLEKDKREQEYNQAKREQAQRQKMASIYYADSPQLMSWDSGTVTTTATSTTMGANYMMVNPTDWNNMQYAIAPMVQEAPQKNKGKEEDLKNLIAYYYQR